ncbi:asparagine synthetase B family protein [Streptomyces aureus]
MSHYLPQVLVRSTTAATARRTNSKVLYSSRTVEILASGADSIPVAEDDDRICVVVGDRPRTMNPADLLSQARNHGLSAAVPTNGHFAAIVLDKHSETVTVLRDPAGFQHLYYASCAPAPAVSTDLAWLLAEGGLDAAATAINPTALGLYVAFQYVPTPFTPYQGIRQLKPGTVLELAPGGKPMIRDGHPLVAGSPDPMPGGSEEHEQRAIDLLQESLASGLNGGGRLGAFLSGGMDTSANVAVLVERLGIKPLALTATFAEPQYDESPYARAVARHYGLEHMELEIQPGMLDDLPSIVRNFDSPHGDRAVFAQHFLAGAAKDAGCEQICTGEGGDEIMGYPRSRDAEDAYLSLPQQGPELASWYLEKTCLAPAPWRQRLLGSLGLNADLPNSHLAHIHAQYEQYAPFERLYFGQWQTWLIDGVYMKDRSVLAGHGLRPVFPFMSTDLMRHMSRLSLAAKKSGLDDKRIVKSALRHSLPSSTLNKTKQKFWLPFNEWFRGPARAQLEDVLLAPQGFVCSQFDRELVRELVDDHLAGSDNSRLLWALLFLELWHSENVQSLRSTR